MAELISHAAAEEAFKQNEAARFEQIIGEINEKIGERYDPKNVFTITLGIPAVFHDRIKQTFFKSPWYLVSLTESGMQVKAATGTEWGQGQDER